MFGRYTMLLLCLPLVACAAKDARLCADGTADPKTAIAACTHLLQRAGQDDAVRATWYANRAQHTQRMGALDDAITDYGEAIRIEPENAAHYVGRGAALGIAGKLDLALRDFDRAITLDPDFPEAHMNRAKVFSDTNRFAEAVRAYDRALSLTEKYWYVYDGRCWVRAVIGQDLKGALSDCERALTMQPGAANALNNRGLVHYRMQRYADSVADYTASIAADSNVASSYYMRGLARHAMGERATAQVDIAEGLRREPGVAKRYAGYGIVAPTSE